MRPVFCEIQHSPGTATTLQPFSVEWIDPGILGRISKLLSSRTSHQSPQSAQHVRSSIIVQLAGPVTQDASKLIPDLKFRIGQYKDHMPFTVTKLAQDQLILGKPWLTYVNPPIDWITNTITVTKGNVTYTLTPPADDESPTVNMLSAMQMKRIIRKGQMAYLAVIREVPEGDNPLEISAPSNEEWQSAIQGILDKHKTIFEKLPKGLPPKRSVDHHIELEPGSKPPYLPIYHMSPLELEELKRQLQTFLKWASFVLLRALMEHQCCLCPRRMASYASVWTSGRSTS